MFREMRRERQLLPAEATEAILHKAQSGVLGVSGDDGYPYTVPISFVYEDGKIYFHSANSGHKLDAIRRNDKVSFCVIDQDQVVPEKFTTHFRSVVVFGRARIIADDTAKRQAMARLVKKYSPEYEEEGAIEISKEWKATSVVEIAIEHMSGKEAKELLKVR